MYPSCVLTDIVMHATTLCIPPVYWHCKSWDHIYVCKYNVVIHIYSYFTRCGIMWHKTCNSATWWLEVSTEHARGAAACVFRWQFQLSRALTLWVCVHITSLFIIINLIIYLCYLSLFIIVWLCYLSLFILFWSCSLSLFILTLTW